MTDTRQDSLAALLGGRGGAVDASLPPLAFVLGWLLSGNSITTGAIAAVACGVLVGVIRLLRGGRPRALLLSVTLVVLAAYIAVRTGRPEDFFLVQIFLNAASALLWTASIALRWPLLGVVVGLITGQRFRWRKDPDLLRAYRIASWPWVGQYVLRVVLFGALWLAGEAVLLAIMRLALTWPLQVACIAISWWVLRRTLPPTHPGLRHPQTP